VGVEVLVGHQQLLVDWAAEHLLLLKKVVVVTGILAFRLPN
jgi:hypothetical protein